MPVAFPDGTSADLLYPSTLDLAEMGVQPDVALLQVDDPGARYPVTFYHGDPDPAVLDGTRPIGRYRTAGGKKVELWSITGELFPAHSIQDYGPIAEEALIYRLSSWTVVVPVPPELKPPQVVGRLEADETPDGFVVVEARDPLALSHEPGEGGGPVLSIGDKDPRESQFEPSTTPPRLITLHRRVGCTPEELAPSGENSPRCFQSENGDLGVDLGVMFGEGEFASTVFDGVQVRNIRPDLRGSPEQPDRSTAVSSNRFVPWTYAEGDRIVMPVTFPDGTTAELLYPEELHLEAHDVRPYSSGYLQGVGRDFSIFHGPLMEVLTRFGTPELLAEYPDDRGGTVGFWRLSDWEEVDHLAFQFGRWTVLVYDYQAAGMMSDENRAMWARNLLARETDDGFLVLESVPPLRLAKAGEHAGPELMFGSPASAEGSVQLFPGRCNSYVDGEGGFDSIVPIAGRSVDRSEGFAGFCIAEASILVHVSQTPDEGFIDAAIRGLEIRNVKLGS